MAQIINSILDTDLYKFTQQFAVIKLHPTLRVEYEFFNRNDVEFPDGFDVALTSEVAKMKTLSLLEEEKEFLIKTCGRFLPPTYTDFLSSYRFDPSEVMIFQDGGKLRVKIRGYWYKTILWEVPLMGIISELYYKMTIPEDKYPNLKKLDVLSFEKASKKASMLKTSDCQFSDFGTRRRFSFDNQDIVVRALKSYGGDSFKGTSNVYLAYKHNLKCTGTMAHEFISAHGALYGYRLANKIAMENWVNVYDGDLGIALTDTFTTDCFNKTFTLKQAKLFDGVRHDSGDPFEYVDKIVKFYQSQNIDPLTKTIVFSDGLNIDLAIKLNKYCNGKIKSAFGIGTHFTNDLKEIGVKPLNMVIKLTKVLVDGEWIGAVKLSDNVGKHTGTIDDIKLCKNTLGIKNIEYNRLPAGNEDDNVNLNIVE